MRITQHVQVVRVVQSLGEVRERAHDALKQAQSAAHVGGGVIGIAAAGAQPEPQREGIDPHRERWRVPTARHTPREVAHVGQRAGGRGEQRSQRVCTSTTH